MCVCVCEREGKERKRNHRQRGTHNEREMYLQKGTSFSLFPYFFKEQLKVATDQ